MERKVIVWVDDLGYFDVVNVGIVWIVYNGLINNVGVMVNMLMMMLGLVMIKDVGVCLGLYIVIFVGWLLINLKLILSIINLDGIFCYFLDYWVVVYDFVDFNEVVLEIEV